MHHTNPQCLLCESTLFEQSMLPPMSYLACSCTFMRKEWYALVYVWYALCFCKRRHFKLTPFHFDSTQSWLLRMYLEVCLVVARCLLVDDMHAHTPTPWIAWQQTEMRREAVWTEMRWEAVCLHPNSCIHHKLDVISTSYWKWLYVLMFICGGRIRGDRGIANCN